MDFFFVSLCDPIIERAGAARAHPARNLPSSLRGEKNIQTGTTSIALPTSRFSSAIPTGCSSLECVSFCHVIWSSSALHLLISQVLTFTYLSKNIRGALSGIFVTFQDKRQKFINIIRKAQISTPLRSSIWYLFFLLLLRISKLSRFHVLVCRRRTEECLLGLEAAY